MELNYLDSKKENACCKWKEFKNLENSKGYYDESIDVIKTKNEEN